ncbi:MAG: hypothetical protein ACYCVL_00590 [Gemmatimonadaceae bacterium]
MPHSHAVRAGAALVAVLFTTSCRFLTAPSDARFNASQTTEIWDFTINTGQSSQVAQVKMTLGSTGSGTLVSDGPPDWIMTSWSCNDPLVISGHADSGTDYSSISFTADSKGGCGVLYMANSYTTSGQANSPSMFTATQASGRLFMNYKDYHTPSYSWTDTWTWTAVRVM